MQCPYLWWHCSSRMGPAGTALCWQPRGLLGSIPENFTLSTLAKLLRKMFSLAKNTVMQDSILTTKSQANILHRKIYVLYSVLSGWKSWPFFCKKATWLFCWPKQFGWIYLLLLRTFKQGFLHWLQEEVLALLFMAGVHLWGNWAVLPSAL